MITIKQIMAKIRKWKRRRDFNALTPFRQRVVRFLGDDPDSLEKREREEERQDG